MKVGYWVLIMCVVISCGRDESQSHILNKQQMAAVMLDLYKAETLMNINRSALLNSDVYPVLKDQIIAEHHLTDSILTANMQYYMERPKLMDEVYTIIIDSLKLRQQEIQPEGAEEGEEMNTEK